MAGRKWKHCRRGHLLARTRDSSGNCRTCANERRAKWVSEHPQLAKRQNRKGNLRKLYGVEYEVVDAMLVAQRGLCACCGQKAKDVSKGHEGLFVDHDHETGKVRALVCPGCNTAIAVADKPELLAAVTRYVAFHKR